MLWASTKDSARSGTHAMGKHRKGAPKRRRQGPVAPFAFAAVSPRRAAVDRRRAMVGREVVARCATSRALWVVLRLRGHQGLHAAKRAAQSTRADLRPSRRTFCRFHVPVEALARLASHRISKQRNEPSEPSDPFPHPAPITAARPFSPSALPSTNRPLPLLRPSFRKLLLSAPSSRAYLSSSCALQGGVPAGAPRMRGDGDRGGDQKKADGVRVTTPARNKRTKAIRGDLLGSCR